MNFWERTWRERSEEIYRAYGDTWPSETVYSFSWDDRVRCPGACALRLPPVESSRDAVRHPRDHWLYLSLGLSQPPSEEQFVVDREAGKEYSAFGVEFAFVTSDEASWPCEALYHFMTCMTDGEYINWGDRFPLQFYRREGELDVVTGTPSRPIPSAGSIRAVVFWPYLFPEWEFVTSTGRFMVLVATGITQAEWECAKETTSAHLMLLLQRCGIGQRTMPERDCLFEESRWQGEWDGIRQMAPEACEAELVAAIGR